MSDSGEKLPIRIIPELAGVDENAQPSNQEAVPVPLIFGEVPIAAKWLSPIYNQYCTEAPQSKRGKK